MNNNNNNKLIRMMVFITLGAIAIGVFTSLLTSFSEGNLEEHWVYRIAPEQTAQVEQQLNDNTLIKFLNGELLNEHLQEVSNLLGNQEVDNSLGNYPPD